MGGNRLDHFPGRNPSGPPEKAGHSHSPLVNFPFHPAHTRVVTAPLWSLCSVIGEKNDQSIFSQIQFVESAKKLPDIFIQIIHHPVNGGDPIIKTTALVFVEVTIRHCKGV